MVLRSPPLPSGLGNSAVLQALREYGLCSIKVRSKTQSRALGAAGSVCQSLLVPGDTRAGVTWGTLPGHSLLASVVPEI